jgi:hypothetical protein
VPKRLNWKAFGLFWLAMLGPLQSAIGQSDLRAKMQDDFKKTCISNQMTDPENAILDSATIVRYCNCVGKHSVDAISVEEFAHVGISGKISRGLQNKLTALGTACASCIKNPPCSDE